MTNLAAVAADKAAAVERLEEAIVSAYRAGRPIAQIAGEAAMSRQAIYDLLDRRGAR